MDNLSNSKLHSANLTPGTIAHSKLAIGNFSQKYSNGNLQ